MLVERVNVPQSYRREINLSLDGNPTYSVVWRKFRNCGMLLFKNEPFFPLYVQYGRKHIGFIY